MAKRPSTSSKSPRTKSTILQRRKLLFGLAALITVAVIALVLSLSHHKRSSTTASGTSAKSPSFASFGPTICPLTDTPAPTGTAPHRPALMIKVGNEPGGARPQSGLNEADIVYDTPAEGGVMRYIAVFQCRDASLVGPNRSVREVDWHIARQFIHPILAYANGIIPDVSTVQHANWLESADLLTNAAGATVRTTTRVPPDNLFSSTSELYALFPKATTPPPPVFQYAANIPKSATPLRQVQINFSYDTDVVWSWNGSSWLHGYASGGTISPDIDTLTNTQVTTNNVVIELVTYKYGPFPESPGATGDVESKTVGTGTGYVLRNGTVTKVVWHRHSLDNPDTFTSMTGAPVALTPGRTFVELLLDTTAREQGALTFTP